MTYRRPFGSDYNRHENPKSWVYMHAVAFPCLELVESQSEVVKLRASRKKKHTKGKRKLKKREGFW